jgi:hypothetical protein
MVMWMAVWLHKARLLIILILQHAAVSESFCLCYLFFSLLELLSHRIFCLALWDRRNGLSGWPHEPEMPACSHLLVLRRKRKPKGKLRHVYLDDTIHSDEFSFVTPDNFCLALCYINTDIIPVRRSRWVFYWKRKVAPLTMSCGLICIRRGLGQAFLGRSCSPRMNTQAGTSLTGRGP